MHRKSRSVDEDDDQHLLHEDTPLLANNTPPWYLLNKKRMLITITIVYLCCVFASGPLITFPTLVPLLMDEHVFEGESQQRLLTLSYSISMGTSYGLFFFTGMVFDWIGAKWSGVIGAVLTCIGFVGFALGVWFQGANYVLFLALPWSFEFGVLNSFSMYGFLWFLPQYQSLLSGLSNSSFQVAGGLSLLFVYLAQHNVTLVQSLFACALLCILAAFLIGIFVPSKHETMQAACRATGLKIDIDPPPMKQQLRNLKYQMSKHRLVNFLFIGWASSVNILLVLIIGNLYPFLILLTNDAQMTDALVNAYAPIFALGGAVLSVMMGFACDKFGIRAFLAVTNLLTVTLFVSMFLNMEATLYLFLTMIAAVYSAVALMTPRFSILYSTPPLFGSYYGIQVEIKLKSS
eukprot:TRINITY_DN7070_c2_g1_i3.p1 TRINITY_DN7070_c2_g1~~TRINITY_DN7070_c2_g1_i3.p1  ORF type:complete len:404 (-),score=72.65 TRINITY_DN7070_c2_g1_i3:157-1368(-)